MQTSATKTSDPAPAPRPVRTGPPPRTAPRGHRGFTLLELLVVVVLVALLTGTVVLGFTGADTEHRLRASAEQLAYTIELGRQYALQRNREWGLYVEPDGVQFAEFDPQERAWLEQTARPFGTVEIVENVALRVESEGVEGLAAAEDEEDLPKVILFSSGEVTPFTVYLEPEWDTASWEVSSDGLSRVEAERAEF